MAKLCGSLMRASMNSAYAPSRTEPDDAQDQHRERGEIQQCINHASSPQSVLPFAYMIYRRPEKFPAAIARGGKRPDNDELNLAGR
jgi:hypothetical protein